AGARAAAGTSGRRTGEVEPAGRGAALVPGGPRRAAPVAPARRRRPLRVGYGPRGVRGARGLGAERVDAGRAIATASGRRTGSADPAAGRRRRLPRRRPAAKEPGVGFPAGADRLPGGGAGAGTEVAAARLGR